jgi:hypothetical protein
MHPDTFYEHNRQYQRERLEASQRKRPFTNPKFANNRLRDRLFLVSGELFITFGKNLKSHAAQPECTQPLRAQALRTQPVRKPQAA